MPGPQQEVFVANLADDGHVNRQRLGEEADCLVEEQRKVRTRQRPLAQRRDRGVPQRGVVRPAVDPNRWHHPIVTAVARGFRGRQALSCLLGIG
jgi:hypothetical protein